MYRNSHRFIYEVRRGRGGGGGEKKKKSVFI